MRVSTLSILTLGLVFAIQTASAGDDFKALLADLSFGDEPKPVVQEARTIRDTSLPDIQLGIANDEVAAELRPAPRGFAMPSVVDAPAGVSLRDPVPAMIDSDQEVDFNAAFDAQEFQPLPTQIKAQPVGFGQHFAHQANAHGCNSVNQCIPHTAPNLPSSSLHEYFRSNKCHTNVWDGYQQNCSPIHKHAHGTCDCFNKKGCFGHGGSCDGCGSCDGGCDR